MDVLGWLAQIPEVPDAWLWPLVSGTCCVAGFALGAAVMKTALDYAQNADWRDEDTSEKEEDRTCE